MIDTIARLGKPECLHDVQKLARRVAALSRFIPRLGEEAMPLYRLMRKNPTFQWDEEADNMLKALKEALLAAPLFAAPVARANGRLGRGLHSSHQRRDGRRATRRGKGVPCPAPGLLHQRGPNRLKEALLVVSATRVCGLQSPTTAPALLPGAPHHGRLL